MKPTTQDTFTLTIPIFFDAAHQLSDSEDLFTKKCAQLHGHTYHAVVTIVSATNEKHGMVIDFKEIKDAVNGPLDHRYINDAFDKTYGIKKREATAENIALFIKEITTELLTSRGVPFISIGVRLAEGYKGPDSTSYVSI